MINYSIFTYLVPSFMAHFLGRHRRPYIVFRNYVNIWLPVRSLVYIYIYIYYIYIYIIIYIYTVVQ